jgi:hypothetical protein
MRVHLLAVLVGAGYYTIGFLTYWLAATPYSKNLGAEAFADGIWAELFPYWAIGQVLLTVWVCFMALGLPIARHRALSAGVGAGLLSLAGIILLGLEDVARVWLDVIGIVAGVVIGLALDRYARSRVLSYPSAWQLIWLWVPGGAFIASAFILINSVVLAFVVDVVTAEAFWLAVPLAGGIIMAIGWVQLARTQRDRDRRIGRELVGSLLILVGAVAPALITMFFFRALFLRQVVGL